MVIRKGPGNRGLHWRFHSNVVPGNQKPEPKVSINRHSPSPPDSLVMRKKSHDTCSWRDFKAQWQEPDTQQHTWIHSQDAAGALGRRDRTGEKNGPTRGGRSFSLGMVSSRDDGSEGRYILINDLHAADLRRRAGMRDFMRCVYYHGFKKRNIGLERNNL